MDILQMDWPFAIVLVALIVACVVVFLTLTAARDDRRGGE